MSSTINTTIHNWASTVLPLPANLSVRSKAKAKVNSRKTKKANNLLRQPVGTPVVKSTSTTAVTSVHASVDADTSKSRRRSRVLSDEPDATDMLVACYGVHYCMSDDKYVDWRDTAKRLRTPRESILPATSEAFIDSVEATTAEDTSKLDACASPESITLSLFDSDTDTDSDASSYSEPSHIIDVFKPEVTISEPEDSQALSSPLVRMGSAIPPHVTIENYSPNPKDLSRWVTVDELDTVDYDVRCLTEEAYYEAEARSRDLKRYARDSSADWWDRQIGDPDAKHELREYYSEPKGKVRPSVLGGLGRGSSLRQSWTSSEEVEEVEEVVNGVVPEVETSIPSAPVAIEADLPAPVVVPVLAPKSNKSKNRKPKSKKYISTPISTPIAAPVDIKVKSSGSPAPTPAISFEAPEDVLLTPIINANPEVNVIELPKLRVSVSTPEEDAFWAPQPAIASNQEICWALDMMRRC